MVKRLNLLIVGATGGLGKHLVNEGLSRGHNVSVLVRNKNKLETEFEKDTLSALKEIYIADAGADTNMVYQACLGKDVVLSGSGGVESVAYTVAHQAKLASVKKFVYVAGATNVMDEDGITPLWKKYASYWPPAERAFISHGKCISAIRNSGIKYVVFCPAMMNEVGTKSNPVQTPKINRESGGFVSYEDAAHVMVDAAELAKWDNQLITAATQR